MHFERQLKNMENLKTKKLSLVMDYTVSTRAQVSHTNASRLLYDHMPYVKLKAPAFLTLSSESGEGNTMTIPALECFQP